jgi:exoribonuclease II
VDKGSLIEIRVQGDPRLAVVERPEGKKHWVVMDERGQAHTIHPRQVVYEIPGQTYKPRDIPAFLDEVKPYLDPASLEVAWEILLEDNQAVDPAAMALLLFSEQSPAQCYAAHCLLSDDKLYFKCKGDLYEPRSATQVADLKHQLEREAQRQQERQDLLARLTTALQGQPVVWSPSDRPTLDALERYAVLGEEANSKSLALEILTELERGNTSQAALQLLVDLGIWSPHENLFLRRSQIPVHFPAKVLEVAHQYLASPPPDPDSNRLDLTHLKVYTIDDESTQEIDDGLSLEFLSDGRQRLWIHIADPTRWLSPGDELELEARRRSTTLYLPTGMVPMFPPELATGPMSLVQGQVCCALSFGVVLDAAGAVEAYEIHATLIKPTYRLTYEDVDEMVELGVQAEPELLALAEVARRRRTWRNAQGAITINMPEASIKVSGDDIEIAVVHDSTARDLVAEMMILAGEVAARFGQAHSLALPFRSQTQPELPPEEELFSLPVGPVRDCAIRRCMPRSEVGTTPGRHASLGLEAYSQVTSPIRRYADLLSHFQIKAHLRGEVPPFNLEALKELIASGVTSAYEATLVERQTNRYWSLEYLRRHPQEIWDAVMLRWLREYEGLGLVLLEDLGLELAMRFHRSVELGEALKIQVTHADPRQDTIQLEERIYQEAL